MRDFRIIGITGRSGSGKTLVTRHYAAMGYPVADGDAVSREVCGPGSDCVRELAAAFGRGILAPDGTLDRAKLAEIAFKSKSGTKKLVNITHPHIVRELLRRAEEARAAGHQLFFVDGAVIVGGPFEAHCDRIVVVTTTQKLALSRITLRDGISKTAVSQRLAAQKSNEELCAAADYVIDNTGSEAALYARADEVLARLMEETPHPARKTTQTKERAMATKKTGSEKLAEQLLAKTEHAADTSADLFDKAAKFCEGYKAFLDNAKTEREAVKAAVALLQKAGYKPADFSKKLRAGDKVYVANRGKALIAATIGKNALEKGVRISAAHIDSPRLDLKPNPLYESEQIAYFKTHYYGGIRKYQWVTIPLAMHGVVVLADGKAVEVHIGEDPGDPIFTITDLLPHLGAEQNKRTLGDGIKGEELNIVIGSLPYADQDAKERVKLETMRLLHEKYGFTERDFTRAEIEFVPAYKAADVGFDRSMVGAYGQDDRVCAYTALMAELDTKNPTDTTVCILADKEEVGSNGNTGLNSDYLFHFLQDLAEAQGAAYRKMLQASKCLSADVNAAYDPTFADVFEKRNASFMNRGIVVTKYTGARGKSGTSDASAEYMGYVTNLFDREGVAWQIGELGKVDAGGGGTVAMFVANRNIDVVDVGVPVLSMHAPFELTGKLDVYSAYRAFVVFAQDS